MLQRFRFTLGALLVATILVTLAACSGTASGQVDPTAAPVTSASNGAQQVTIPVSNGMSFDPAAVMVQAGQPVQLTLRNTGLMPHDFTLTDGVAQPVHVAASGGQTATGTFTIESPGTYTFDCSMPGHAAAGMRGTITAQ